MNLLEVRANPQVLPNYRIEIKNPGDTIVVSFGCPWGEASAKLSHPNIAASLVRKYEFKHYQSIRGKWWTSQVGVTHYAFFRLADLTLADLSGPGYSYIKLATPNGERFTLSVSGGGGECWTDWLGGSASSFVGTPARRLSRIFDAAVKPPRQLEFPELEQQEQDQIRRMLVAKQAMGLRPLPRLWLKPGLGVRGYTVPEDGGLPVAEDHRGRRHFVCGTFPFGIRVKHTQVDWTKTGEKLGVVPPDFDRFGRLLAG